MSAQPILNLTDTQAVMGSAGISAGDVSDARLIASALEDDLSLHLYMRLPSWEVRILAAADPVGADTKTKMIALAIKNYARLYCASVIASRWAYFKQLISDGKVRNDRFDRMDLAQMQANIDAMRDAAWGAIEELLEEDIPDRAPYIPFGLSLPGSDPVTDLED